MAQEMVRAHRAVQPQHRQSQKGPMVFGYIYEKDDLELFDDKIQKYVRDGIIPDLDTEAEYTIYRWKAGFGKHESIVLGCKGKFITLELRVVGKITLYTTCEGINETTLKECGKLLSTGLELIAIAQKVYFNQSAFNFGMNNCQDFVNNFLSAVELKDQVKDTDFDWSLKTIGKVAVVGIGAFLAYSLTKDRSKK